MCLKYKNKTHITFKNIKLKNMMQYFFNQYFGHDQCHPLLQFVDNETFDNLLSVCKNLNDLPDQWKKYFKLTWNKRCDYSEVCGKLGIIPIQSMMTECTLNVRAVHVACYNEHVSVIKWMFSKKPSLFSPVVFCIACIKGNIELAKWCYDNELLPNKRFYESEKLHHRTDDCAEDLINAACKNGHLDIIEFLFEKRDVIKGWSNSAISFACSNNRLDVVKWIHQHFPNLEEHPYPNLNTFGPNKTDAIDIACHNGNLELAQWIYSNLPNYGYTNKAALSAAARGHLDILIWLDSIGAHFTKDILNEAAKNGQNNIVDWIIVKKPELPFTSKALDLACENGHLEIAKKLYNFPKCKKYTTRAFDGACKNGHFDVAQWLYNEANAKWDCINNFPLCTTDAIDYASTCGHLNIVQWLCGIGAPYSESAITGACMNGHIDIVMWLYNNACATIPTPAISIACGNKQYELVKHLFENIEAPHSNHGIEFATFDLRQDIVSFINNSKISDPEFTSTKNYSRMNEFMSSIKQMSTYCSPTCGKELRKCFDHLHLIRIRRTHSVNKPKILLLNI